MALSEPPILVAITRDGGSLAKRLRAALPGAEVHGLAGRVDDADTCFENVAEHLRAVFARRRPIVGILAAGIIVRALAPVLGNKRDEPPVIALGEDGRAIVPLLGGHRGANDMARRIARATGGRAALTTASDLRFGLALDDPPSGWRLANPEHYRAFSAALLAGQVVKLTGDAPWLRAGALPLAAEAPLEIRVTDGSHVDPVDAGETVLVYHPARLCVGVGCERGADPAELEALVLETLDRHHLCATAVAGVFSVDVKADEGAIHALADALSVPARFFPAAVLEAETPRLARPSEVVFREVGCHGVAEGAALAASGPAGELIVEKTVSGRSTCAIARAPRPVDPMTSGRARGRLLVVGLGPGPAATRTPEVRAALESASDLVGYAAYLDLVADVARGAARHPYPLGAETERVEAALGLAGEGRAVALVCSGDPGIYAMASLVFERLDDDPPPAWRRIAVEVMPGISALQSAAARAGAPLGHDFCAISLSDLLTPWPVIERRLVAAAQGDFVVAIYNPASRRRTHQLARALEILSSARPDDTPLVIARNLGREREQVRVTTLGAADVGEVDMMTTLVVGSSETRRVPGPEAWVYTPRGYAGKAR